MAYIDRDKTLDILRERQSLHEENGDGGCADSLLDMCEAIENLPTADVEEVKHGEWDVNVGMNFNKERICPICKKRIESNYWEFCSHCGAKMDGGVQG